MKIYIDKENNIININSTTDLSLTEIEIDRSQVFGEMSDYLILNYKYIPSENGFSIIPQRNLEELLTIDYRNKIDILINDINELKAFNAQLIKTLDMNAAPLI